MEIKHLNTFLVLSRLMNFTKTAEHLGYAQSSVTTQMQKLEEELKVRLFERIGKSVSLTPEGERLVPYARKLVALSVDIESMFAGSKTGGALKIGASESIGIYRLPAMIKAYKRAHPEIDLYLEILDSSEFLPLLANRTIDIAFTLDKRISDTSIITSMEIEEPLCVLAYPGHPLTEKKNVDVQDFADLPFILTGYGCCYRKMFEQQLAAHFVAPRIVLETSSIQAIKESAKSGLGLCVLPEFAAAQEIANGELVNLRYCPECNLFTQLIYHKDKWVSPA